MTNLKAVIPVAGLGCICCPPLRRFPKRCYRSSTCQWFSTSLTRLWAGIKEILLVLTPKNAVENHFTSYELESLLNSGEASTACGSAVHLSTGRDHYERASGANLLGLGHSILCARPAMVTTHLSWYCQTLLSMTPAPTAALQPCCHDCLVSTKRAAARCWQNVCRWPLWIPVIQTKEPLDREGKVSRIVEFIEKPDQPQMLDSDIMAVGRYALSADIYRNWNVLSLVHGDVFSWLMPLLSWQKTSSWRNADDCGQLRLRKENGYMQAFVKYGLRNLKEGAKFRKHWEVVKRVTNSRLEVSQ